MMKPLWLIEKDLFLDTEPQLIEIIKQKGFPIKVVQYIPFDDDLSQFDKITNKNIIYYGSLNLALKLKKFNWTPGVYGDIKKYSCSSYYPYFKPYLFNSDYLYMTYADLYTIKDYLFNRFGDAFFVRPDSILKEFTGQIVADGEVITGSLYRIKEKEETLHLPCTDDKALEFAKQMTKVYNPDKVWVLDVCLSEGEYKVLEIGCFSFAGLYGNDLEIIVDKVSKIAEEQYREENEWNPKDHLI